MDEKFSMMLEDNSAKEIGMALLKVRGQLITSAQTLGRLESEELKKLREFNEQKNEARKRREQEEDKSEESEEEAPVLETPKPKGPVVDDDGFEMVTQKKGGRRK